LFIINIVLSFHGLCLLKITNGFFYACDLFNVCGVIEGSYIPFSQKLDKHVITIFTNYYRRQKSYNLVVLQNNCDIDKLFWIVCCLVPNGMVDEG
jgi:hypothetical protein